MSKVSALVRWLHKATRESTFENVYKDNAPNRFTTIPISCLSRRHLHPHGPKPALDDNEALSSYLFCPQLLESANPVQRHKDAFISRPPWFAVSAPEQVWHENLASVPFVQELVPEPRRQADAHLVEILEVRDLNL